MNDVILEVTGLRKEYPLVKGLGRTVVGSVRAVDGVDLVLRRGETLGLVGESGCGKTTVGKCLVRAIEPTAGTVRLRARDGREMDILAADKRGLKDVRRIVRIVFQDPFSSLNPRMNVYRLLSECLVINGIERNARVLRDRVAAMLERVGLEADHMQRYPHAFSGGQRQRIAIARALISDPEMLVADEPVSALDVSVQAQVLNLLSALRDDLGLSMLFIAHNLSVVEYMCDRIAVMYMGRIVELADNQGLFAAPGHPYTEALLAAIPIADPSIRRQARPLEGEIGDLAKPPSGCHFHPRCPYVQERCRVEEPHLRDFGGRSARCLFAGSLKLKGIGNEGGGT